MERISVNGLNNISTEPPNDPGYWRGDWQCRNEAEGTLLFPILSFLSTERNSFKIIQFTSGEIW